MSKLLSFILSFIILLPLMISCTSDSRGSVKSKNTDDVLNTNGSDTSHVPNDLAFIGEDFTILCREDNAYGEYLYEISADEGETELVNQAIYQRNRDIKDIFGLNDIIAKDIPGDWGNGTNFVNTFRNSIDAGLGEFDLIMGYEAYMATGELLQYYYDFNSVPYVKDSLDHSYYYQDCINEITVNGQLKFIVSDYSLTYWDHVYVMYFNKKIAEEYAINNIYDMVKDGTWTYDKCLELSKGKWKDNNNDNWKDEADTFGYISDIPNTMDAFHAHFDVQPTEFDSSGNITFNMDVGKVTNILETVIDFKSTNDCYTEYMTSGDIVSENPLDKIFREGRALFYHETLSRAEMFRSMDIDFGIIPFPKWDVYQDKYYTHSDPSYSVTVVPADAPDLEMTGAVFDTLAALSKKNVIPAYYDQALKYKYTRDEDSAEMLDIIREGFTVNFGYFYSNPLDCGNVFRDCIPNDNTNFASYYAAKKKGYERKLKLLLEYFE